MHRKILPKVNSSWQQKRQHRCCKKPSWLSLPEASRLTPQKNGLSQKEVDMTYAELTRLLAPKSWPDDTGKFWTFADGKTKDLPGLGLDELRAFAQRAGDKKTFEEYAVANTRDQKIDQAKYTDTNFDNSADDLLNNLQSAKAAHQLPLIASIDLHQKDLQSAENHHSPLDLALHAMALSDEEKSTRMVYISDSTGGKEDGWIPVDTVFAAMQSASNDPK
jgi:hypothetical protein